MMTDQQVVAEIEDLVSLLNSWRVPNDTRVAVDELAGWAHEDRWREHFVLLPRPAALAELIDVRDALRETVSGGTPAVLNRLLTEMPPQLAVAPDATLDSAPARDDTAAVAVWLAFRLAVAGRLARLRTCPDCGWAFYDTSRNGKRVWCAMTTADGGRGCGSIAKTRAYRARAGGRPGAEVPGEPVDPAPARPGADRPVVADLG